MSTKPLIEIAILDEAGREFGRVSPESLRATFRHLPDAETRVLADLIKRFNDNNKRNDIADRLKLVINKEA